jgi:Kef-type K+ transport system membrane component KefB/nucleotide-binding universal stress UspA family protein
MNNVTLGIAVLLSAGVLGGWLARLLRLPSVTGYILAGLVLGPSFSGLIAMETLGQKLEHFTQIALMLIAFGIGEHIEIRRMKGISRDIGFISIVQALGAFLCVAAGTAVTSWLLAAPDAGPTYHLILALLLGSVAIATAPATLLHVVRETGARGPLTSTLMAVVAFVDGIAIMMFGLAVSIGHQLIGPGTASTLRAVAFGTAEIIFSLGIGVITGLLLDFVLKKLHSRAEMLTGGLALLLLCGEITSAFQFSPLLAGMAAGFTIINRAERDVRLFRAINAFEPPIYVLFFTLAGAHMDLGALKVAGWIGIIYFVSRVFGKYFGTMVGGLMSGAPPVVRNYMGLALVPQAGVAIGLVLLISNDPPLAAWSAVITPVVLAGVVLSELCGPFFAKYTLAKAGETEEEQYPKERGLNSWFRRLRLNVPEAIRLQPWQGDKLHPSSNPNGVVAFGANHFATVRGLARIATFLAHHYHALPLSVRVLPPSENSHSPDDPRKSLFLPEIEEAASLGYPMQTELLFDSPSSGLVSAAEQANVHAVVLGYPAGRSPRTFHRILDTVAASIPCPLIAVRFVGTFKANRILVPFLSPSELGILYPVLEALAMATLPRITFVHLLHSDSSREEIAAHDQELQEWLADNFFDIQTRHMAEAAESRLEFILNEARYHDLILMTATRNQGLARIFFGSLSNSVVRNCQKPVLVVYPSGIQSDTSIFNAKKA